MVPEQTPTFKRILVSEIDLNPNNPRGPNVRDRDPAFEYLKQSVRELGVLVPLVVKPADGRYLLIDGERRYHAARELRLKKVPAYIIRKDWDQAAVQGAMFHIHMNWLPWKPAQELRASEPLYARLVQELGDPYAPGIIDAYVRATGTNKRTARNRLQFLRWPRDIKHKIYDQRQDDYWYVIEIEDKIVEPAMRNYPEYFRKVAVDKVRRFLFEKLEEKVVKKAIEVREASVVASSRAEGPDRKAVIGIIDRLVQDRHFTFGEARDAFLELFPEAAQPPPLGPVAALNRIRQLADMLGAYDPSYFVGQTYPKGVDPAEFKDALAELRDAIVTVLKELED
jgi:hypothetical protein